MTSFNGLKPVFERDGFVVVRRFLVGNAFDELSRNLERYIREVVPELPGKAAFYQDPERPETLKQLQAMDVDPYFREYMKHPQWCALAEGLIGHPVSCSAPEWFSKPPQTQHPTPPHQDNYYFCLEPPDVLTIWLALETINDENGCLRYVPGSHRLGIRDHQVTDVLGFSQSISDYSQQDVEREVPVHLEAGDVVVHHGNTIHRAEANPSTRHRPAFAMVFRADHCIRDEVAFERYAKSSDSQQSSLGVDE